MAATAQFLTPSITKILLLYGETELSSATGFFLKSSGQWYLVSNWHVFSGCDPKTGQPAHKYGAVPNRCIFFKASLSDEALVWTSVTYDLGSALVGDATWRQHAVHGQDVDVAVLPISEEDVGLAKDLLDPTGHDEHMFIDLGGEVFIPGFPLGLTAGGLFPFWKRGSLSSSLHWGEGIEKFFYIDTASREGMSGSPCLAIANWRYYRLNPESRKMEVYETPLMWRLLGVYSGRLGARDDFGAQIGIVWREKLVFSIMESGVNGAVLIR